MSRLRTCGASAPEVRRRACGASAGQGRRLFALLFVLLLPRVAAAQVPETIEYYGQDAIGSIRVVFKPDGAVVARQDYAPFGRPLFPAPAMPKEGFGGQEKDDESDQAYFHARMFQARTGRFTQPDPIQAGLFEPQRWNRYAYALNNSVSSIDPSGLNAAMFSSTSVPACEQFDCDFWLQMQLWWYFGGSFGGGSGGGSGSSGSGGGGGGGGATPVPPDPIPDPGPQPSGDPGPSPPGPKPPGPNPPPTPQPRPMPTKWQQFRFCVSYVARENVPKTAAQYGSDLKKTAIFSVGAGTVFGGMLLFDPPTAPLAPLGLVS